MKCLLSVVVLGAVAGALQLPAQQSGERTRVTPITQLAAERTGEDRPRTRFRSRADSLEHERARRLAAEARGYRVVISL